METSLTMPTVMLNTVQFVVGQDGHPLMYAVVN